MVHNNSLINVIRALVERVYYVEGPNGLTTPPKPHRSEFNRLMAPFQRLVFAQLRPVQRMCLRTFVRTSPEHKRRVYEQALIAYLRNGLTGRDAWVTSFIKAEKVNGKKGDPAPRIIQPRGVKFNLVYGCFIRPAEKELYAAIDRVFGRPTVVCGQNAEQQGAMLRAAWDAIADPVAISYDLSRMDQHVSDVALKWEHAAYRYMFRNDPCLSTLVWCLDQTIRNVGICYTTDHNGVPHKVNYTKRGSRMSGDMNTSSGNKYLMCAMCYNYFTGHLGYVVGVDYVIVDNGDDCVVILSRAAYLLMLRSSGQQQQIDRLAVYDPANWNVAYIVQVVGRIRPPTHMGIEEFFRRLGFTIKEEGLVHQFEKIEFCQTQPCFIDGRWIMVRGLTALSKDCYCLKQPNVFEQWLQQVASAGQVCYGSVPIYSSFYKALSRTTTDRRNLMEQSGMYYLSAGMSSTGVVTEANRVAFYNTFGVTPREQELIEYHYDSYVRTTWNTSPSYGYRLPM